MFVAYSATNDIIVYPSPRGGENAWIWPERFPTINGYKYGWMGRQVENQYFLELLKL